jgi:hypothetical protein
MERRGGTYIAKDTEKHDPEEQYQHIPDEDEWYADYERDQVHDCSES